MRYRGLIFDLDGTLGNTLPATYRAFRDVFMQRTGVAYSDDEIHAMFGPNEEGVFQRRLPDEWEAAHADYLAAYGKCHDNAEALFEGVAEGLAAFADAHARLAIVTAKGKGCAEITVDLLGFGRYFEHLECGHHDGCVKADNIAAVLNAWHMPPEQAVYIGDAPTDIRAAHKACVTAVAAAWAPTAKPDALEAEKPDFLFNSWPDFQHWALENLMRVEVPAS